MNKLMRKERGITLIALVVTVIVLLILAGVSIQMLAGQSGILTQAKRAREETEIGQVKDYVQQGIPETTLTITGLTQKYGTYNLYWESPTWWESWPGYNKDGGTDTAKDMEYRKLIKHEQYSLIDNQAENVNSRAVSQLLNKDAWNGIKELADEGNKEKIDFVIGGPTLEMWCAAWNKSVKEDSNGFKEIKPIADDTGYKLKSGETENTVLFMNGTTSSIDQVNALDSDQLNALQTQYLTFFPHAGNSSYDNCYGYWLASPSAEDPRILLRVRFSGHIGLGGYENYGFCVRPVVCLKSGAQLQEREIKEDGTTIYDLV